MTREEIDAQIKEIEARIEAHVDALDEEMGKWMAAPMTPAEEARRQFIALYEQICFHIWTGQDLTGGEFVASILKAVKEENLTDADVRAVRKKFKAVNSLRESKEELARAAAAEGESKSGNHDLCEECIDCGACDEPTENGKLEQIVCEIMPRWLGALDAALGEELSKRRKAKRDAKIEAAEKRLFDQNPYGGQFREQYADRSTRELYLPIPQNIPILECLSSPCTARNSELTDSGDTLVRAGRGYSYLILAKDRRDEKTGELIELTQNKSLNAILTLLFVLVQWARQRDSLDPKLPRLAAPIDEFMALRGLTDERNARIQLAGGLQILQCTTIPKTDAKGLGEAYQLLQRRNVPRKGNNAEADLSAAFHEDLNKWYDNMMPLPLSLLKLNPEYDGLALVAGLQLAWNQFYYYGESQSELGVKGSELARRAEPLLPSEEKLREGDRHITRQRIDPIFNAVSRLANKLGGTASHVDLYRLSDGEPATASDAFTAICLTATATEEEEEAAEKEGKEAQAWKSYPDISAERKEARAARNGKRKEGKK